MEVWLVEAEAETLKAGVKQLELSGLSLLGKERPGSGAVLPSRGMDTPAPALGFLGSSSCRGMKISSLKRPP
jgi:hypothetical protein